MLINGFQVTKLKVLEGMILISGVVELFLVVRVTNLIFIQLLIPEVLFL